MIADVLDDAGRRVAAELGDAARFQHLDVTNEADWHAAVQATLAQFGRLDILVNKRGDPEARADRSVLAR